MAGQLKRVASNRLFGLGAISAKRLLVVSVLREGHRELADLIPRSMAAEITSWVSDHAASASGVIRLPSASLSVSIKARLLTAKCASWMP